MHNTVIRRISTNFLFVITFTGQLVNGINSVTVPIYANMLGASPLLIGIIGSVGGLTYSLVPFISGVFFDRFRKKLFVLTSLILNGSISFLYSYIQEPSTLILVKVLEWISIGVFWPSIEALIADHGFKTLEKPLMAFNISWGSATIIGPLIGGTLINEFSIKAPFLFSSLTSIIIGFMGLFAIKEDPKDRNSNSSEKTISKPKSQELHILLTALLSVFLFSSIGGINISVFPSQATDLGISPFYIGVVVFSLGASRTFAFSRSHIIKTRLNKIDPFIFGAVILAFASIFALFSKTTVDFTFCFIIFGLGSGFLYASSISFFLEHQRFSKGYAAGIFESLIGTGSFVGPLAGGAIYEYTQFSPYLFGVLLSLSILAILVILKTKEFLFSPSKTSVKL